MVMYIDTEVLFAVYVSMKATEDDFISIIYNHLDKLISTLIIDIFNKLYFLVSTHFYDLDVDTFKLVI